MSNRGIHDGMSHQLFQDRLLRGEAEPALQAMPHDFQLGSAPIAIGTLPRTFEVLAVGSHHQPPSAAFRARQSILAQLKLGGRTDERAGKVMQRAIALGVIQLYARSEALQNEANPTPLILMLDEPETWY